MGRINNQDLLAYTKARKDDLGAVAEGSHGRRFRYVFSAKKTVKGQPVSIVSTANTAAQKYGYSVANSATAANSTKPAGIAIGLISASCYGWILSQGPLGDIGDGLGTIFALTDKGVAAGERCVKDEATDGMLDTYARTVAGTEAGNVFVRALAADSGSHLAAGLVTNIVS